MQVEIEARTDHRYGSPIGIPVRRILIVQRVEHQRNIEAAMTDNALPIADPQQQARSRRIGGVTDAARVHLRRRIVDQVEFRLRRDEQERQRIEPGKGAGAIVKGPVTGIVIVY